MTLGDLIEKVAQACDLSKKDARAAVEATFAFVGASVADGAERFAMPGFGVFTVRYRKARVVRNPQHPKQLIQLPRTATIGFRPAGELRKRIPA